MINLAGHNKLTSFHVLIPGYQQNNFVQTTHLDKEAIKCETVFVSELKTRLLGKKDITLYVSLAIFLSKQDGALGVIPCKEIKIPILSSKLTHQQ